MDEKNPSSTVESWDDEVEVEVYEMPHREAPSVFKATKMFFNIHLVSYLIDEDAAMFLSRSVAVPILLKKKKTSFILLLNLQHRPLSRTREAVAVRETYWWKIKESVYVMRFCQYWM